MAKLHQCVSLLAAVALSACSLAPRYQVPDVPVAAAYKTQSPWTLANPSDQLDRARWWTLYHEPKLDELEQRLIDNNHDIRAAYFHYVQSQAYVKEVSRSKIRWATIQ